MGAGQRRASAPAGAENSTTGSMSPVWRPRGKSAAYPWRGRRGLVGRLPRQTVGSERGNHLVGPRISSGGPSAGKARRRLMPVRWGGGPVVVGDWESRSQGEGVQRVRNIPAAGGGR